MKYNNYLFVDDQIFSAVTDNDVRGCLRREGVWL